MHIYVCIYCMQFHNSSREYSSTLSLLHDEFGLYQCLYNRMVPLQYCIILLLKKKKNCSVYRNIGKWVWFYYGFLYIYCGARRRNEKHYSKILWDCSTQQVDRNFVSFILSRESKYLKMMSQNSEKPLCKLNGFTTTKYSNMCIKFILHNMATEKLRTTVKNRCASQFLFQFYCDYQKSLWQEKLAWQSYN